MFRIFAVSISGGLVVNWQATKLSGVTKVDKIIIITNSLETVKALTSKMPTNYNDETKKVSLRKISVLWYPGHSGDFYNEKAN